MRVQVSGLGSRKCRKTRKHRMCWAIINSEVQVIITNNGIHRIREKIIISITTAAKRKGVTTTRVDM